MSRERLELLSEIDELLQWLAAYNHYQNELTGSLLNRSLEDLGAIRRVLRRRKRKVESL